MGLSIIVATNRDNVIGIKNDLPWELPKDLKYFSKVTKGKTVVMGKSTFESIQSRIGKPLPGRKNIILAFEKDYKVPGCTVLNDWESVIELAKTDDIFVIGGAMVYKTALPYTNTLYITEVETKIDNADCWFPEVKYLEWNLIKEDKQEKDEENAYDMNFKVYKRKKPIEFLDFGHARTPEQIKLMKEIEEDGVCPFCEEYFKKYHPKEILKETDNWMVSENMSPYKGTKLHLIVVYKEHTTMPGEVSPEAMAELSEIFKWAEDRYKLKAYSFFMRCGDTRYTGGSVNHTHIQLLLGSAKSDDKKKDKLKVKLGYKK